MRYPDWYKLQKDMQGWEYIPSDFALANRLSEMNLKINFDYCHYGLKDLLPGTETDSDQPDFFILTDIELSKTRLENLVEFYRECYDRSKVGIYISILSYYLSPTIVRPDLPESYPASIDIMIRELCSFAGRIENWSEVVEFPVEEANRVGEMIEGTNYIFVHPNIRYFLWK